MELAELPEVLLACVCSFLEARDCSRCQLAGEARLLQAAQCRHLSVSKCALAANCTMRDT